MKLRLFLCFLGLASSASGLASAAQARMTFDCGVARDPRRCEAQQAAQTACAGLPGEARSACVRDALPPPDCNRAPSTARCEQKQAAATACEGRKGKARNRCLREFRADNGNGPRGSRRVNPGADLSAPSPASGR